MNNATRRSLEDLRRITVCAILATLTSLGTFSLVAEVVAPLLAGRASLAVAAPASALPVDLQSNAGACVETVLPGQEARPWKPALI
jgi:hypothetical protein